MMRMNTPKKVTLPNGQTFAGQYKHVSRAQLPANVTIRRRYTQRAATKSKRRRGWQRGHEIFDFVKKVIKNLTIRVLGQQAAKHLPGLCNAATS